MAHHRPGTTPLQTAQPQARPPGFHVLLYRYLFFAWLFRDVSRGTLLERAAAWRHNQAHAHWLLTYMRRWCWCGLLFYGAGCLVELGLNAPLASTFFYIPGVLSVPINTVMGVAWLGLKLMNGPV